MPEIIASCFVESIGTNVLFVKDIFTESFDIIVCIKDKFYSCKIPIATKYVESVIHAFENGLISIRGKTFYVKKLYYSIIINGECYYLTGCYPLLTDNKILKFATENRDLFEYNGRPILK